MVAAPESVDAKETRLAQGLLRCTVERRNAVDRAEHLSGDEKLVGDEAGGWLLRRRDGQPVLLAARADLLDVAEALGRRADALVDEANLTGTEALVPASRVAAELGRVLTASPSQRTGSAATPPDGAATSTDTAHDGLRDGLRLARLGAHLARHAGASAAGELHHRDLTIAAALRRAVPAVLPGQAYEAKDLRDRVGARFPDLAPLPSRPDLDQIAQQSLGLRWDDDRRTYLAPAVRGGDTTGLDSRPVTRLSPAVGVIGPGAVGQRLADSRGSRSFLALGVGALYLERFFTMLRTDFDVVEVDLTHTLMDALHETAASAGIPWSEVLGADSDVPGSRPYQGLRALVQRSLPAVREAVEQAIADADGRPVVLVDASLLARYDALGLLTDWLDLATARPTAIWLVVPQLHSRVGPVVDGHPLPLTAPSQYVAVPPEWILTHRSVPIPQDTATQNSPAPEGLPQ